MMHLTTLFGVDGRGFTGDRYVTSALITALPEHLQRLMHSQVEGAAGGRRMPVAATPTGQP